MEYYLVITRNEVLIDATTWTNLGNYAKRKKPDTKGHIWYNSVHMKCAR